MYMITLGSSLVRFALQFRYRLSRHIGMPELTNYWRAKWLCTGMALKLNFKSHSIALTIWRLVNNLVEAPIKRLVSLHLLLEEIDGTTVATQSMTTLSRGP